MSWIFLRGGGESGNARIDLEQKKSFTMRMRTFLFLGGDAGDFSGKGRGREIPQMNLG